MPLAVRMKGISQSFGEVKALQAVDLAVETGTIHAVIGENGAGKTTLARALYGAFQPDAGTIELFEKSVRFANSAQAIEAGVGMVSQHYGIIGGLTCLQNLLLGAEPGPILDLRRAKVRADQLAEEMGFHFNWGEDAETLSPAMAQKLEILKLLWRQARVMILDEPTAMLSPLDGESLFISLKRLVARGATVILVTHRLREVMDHCERVTVLRAGKKIADLRVSETDTGHLARLVIGGELAPPPPLATNVGVSKLVTRNLTARNVQGLPVLHRASLSIGAGEIVGVAGVDGSGQRELVQALFGLIPSTGEVHLDGQRLDRSSTAERLKMGLRLMPEDRLREAVVERWPLDLNAALGLQRNAHLSNRGRINVRARTKFAEDVLSRFATKFGSIQQPIGSLSGGNQQRFVAARTLALDPHVIVAFQPARGLDIHGARAVYQGIREACVNGASALIISFDLDELLEYCDRIVTMFDGRVQIPSVGHERDREAIGHQMVGTAPNLVGEPAN